MVFQNYALYPHMDVAQNMGFALELAGVPRERIATKVNEAARILGIEMLLARKPRELSGGQRQRVAMGRAIVREPKVFLFDEPLSNLDAKLRGQMRVEIALLHRRLGKTTVYVTHDQVEAMTLADRIVVLDAGRIQQVGSPDDVFNRPTNQFVAGFIGSPTMNFLPVRIAAADGELRFEGPGFGTAVPPAMRARAGALAGSPAVLGVRPQSLRLGAEQAALVLPLEVQVTEYLGTETVLACRLRGAPDTPVTVVAPGRHVLPPGSPVVAGAGADSLHAFEAGGHGPSLSN
jgi:ABC-type sugar transport system ATPase subunit